MKYQDYVIKEGVLIGKFEEMYKTYNDPWYQSSIDTSISRQNTIKNIKKFNIKSIVEFGCGLGYYTNKINRETNTYIKGIDISPTAINKAKQLHKDLDFEVNNVKNIKKYYKYDAILFSEITWYILDYLEDILKDMLQYFEGKYFLNNQVFYKGQQQYGNNYFTCLTEFINYIPFELIGYSESTSIKDDTIETSTIFKIVVH